MKITDRKVLTEELKTKMELLTPKECSYFRMMWPKSGVVYITSKPGIAPSAIIRESAIKMGFVYKDIRLSQKDETDVGLYPDKVEIEGVKCLDFVPPKWAIESNKAPTIIHFEELNRATQQVRNAALQILLEREIGDFKFNDNVLMIASGNLGEEDGTEVEEFDKALNNRLIHVNHILEPHEWIECFAKDNIHNSILSFIRDVPQFMYRDPVNDDGNNSKAYASPRTWTFLSNYIVCNYGPNAAIDEFINDIISNASCYVGSSALRYIQYCKELVNININDIINRYDDVKDKLFKCKRDKFSELIQDLKTINLEKLSDNQIDNVHKFLSVIGEDELTDFLIGSVSDTVNIDSEKVRNFYKKYSKILLKINGIHTKKR